jgi:hypothetical protein
MKNKKQPKKRIDKPELHPFLQKYKEFTEHFNFHAEIFMFFERLIKEIEKDIYEFLKKAQVLITELIESAGKSKQLKLKLNRFILKLHKFDDKYVKYFYLKKEYGYLQKSYYEQMKIDKDKLITNDVEKLMIDNMKNTKIYLLKMKALGSKMIKLLLQSRKDLEILKADLNKLTN